MERNQLATAVAENTHFRGLFGVVCGLVMIVSSLGNAGWGPFDHDAVFIVAVAVLGLVALALNRYYNDRFGWSRPTERHHRRMAAAILLGAPAVFLGSMLLSSRASWSLDLPLNTIAISIALFMLMITAATVGIRRHHAVIFGCLLVAGLLPVWDRQGMSGNTGLWMSGVALILAGLLDHRLLVRTFGPAGTVDPEDDRAHA
jgi:hypothetical protein